MKNLKAKISNNTIVRRLLDINAKTFPFSVLLTYFLLFLETYTYLGFVEKYVGIEVKYFLLFTVISAAVESVKEFFKKVGERKLINFVFKINKILFPLSLFLYLTLNLLEDINYVNYVFTHLHLHPQNLYKIVQLSAYLLILNCLRNSNKILKNLQRFTNNFLKVFYMRPLFVSLNLLFIVFLSSFIYRNFISTFKKSFDSNMYILAKLNLSYEDKMREKWGLLYEVIDIIQKNTPIGATVILPPADPPHSVDGRKQYYQYFMADRKFVNYEKGMDIKKYDYVVVASGFLHPIYDGNYEVNYIWPFFKIKTDNFIYFEKIGYREYKFSNTYDNYDPKDYFDKRVWGLIQIHME